MYSARDDTALPVPGFPIRVSAGQSLFSSSPRLIAAVHALLRLLMPRHPPCALTILTVIVDSRRRLAAAAGYNGDLPLLFGQLCSFQGPARAQPRDSRLVSQNSAVQGALAEAVTPPGPVDVSGRRTAKRPARRARP